MSTPVALQLYTLRAEMKDDFLGILDKVAAIGYSGVEFAGFGGYDGATLRKRLDDLGLRAVASHVMLDALESDLPAAVDMHLALGAEWIVVPWIAADARSSADAWIALAGRLAAVGARLRTYGLRLGYHNHDFEFVAYDGVTGHDLLFRNSDAPLLHAELDLYWVAKAGLDPVETIRRFAGRVPLLHLKDMANDAERSFAEVGAGLLDWPAIFNAAEAAGTQWYIVEQDRCLTRPPLEAVALSLANLRAMGVG